jgi:L-Lysine epsilon oxidase N-terminal
VDPEHTPLDRATKRWEEALSAPVYVATLTLARQDVAAPGQAEYGEDLSFNTWHALPEHAPVGSLGEARKVAYQAAADLRRERNGVPLEEPTEPRPISNGGAVGRVRDDRVVRAAIHPAIGIARVGNSEDQFFVGPEVDEPPPLAPDSYKDDTGALKRQAARFRIYGYNGAGEVVAELTPDDADIRWTVHVANTKAAWYEFQVALDIPEASRPDAIPSRLRNMDLAGPARDQLAIDPGPRRIAGREQSGAAYHFASGEFMGKQVYLGELRTDESGRLLS